MFEYISFWFAKGIGELLLGISILAVLGIIYVLLRTISFTLNKIKKWKS